jgi:hypothetical protein
MNKKKILLVQLYSNGDCLYVTAIAKQIKKDFPDCILTWAIADYCKSILEHNTYVDNVWAVSGLRKKDIKAFRKFKKEVNTQKRNGVWDEVYFIQTIDSNQAYYDGYIRSSLFNAYPRPIDVDITPELKLSEVEKKNAEYFVDTNLIKRFQHRILFEFAPQSGQSNITLDFAIAIAENIVKNSDSCVIMSSAHKIVHANSSIIDGSTLNLRETAALTHHCTLLLGTSSGITWISTSSGAKLLPMIQLIHHNTYGSNFVSRDFEKFNISRTNLIEIHDNKMDNISDCVLFALNNFKDAKNKYNQIPEFNFKTTRKITYNLLCYFQFKAIIKHIKINTAEYGIKWSFLREVAIGFVTFPFILIKNAYNKTIKGNNNYA